MQTKKLIKFLFLFSLLVMSFVTSYLGKMTVLVTDLINMVLLSYLFQNNKKFSIIISVLGKPVYYIFTLLIFLGLISSLLNFVSPLETLWGFRTFYRYAIFFIACIAFLDIRDSVFYENWLRKILIVNFAFSTIQFFFLQKIGDENRGTLSGNGGLYILCYISLTYFVIAYMYKRISLLSMSTYLSMILFIAVFAELKVIFLLIPITYAFGLLFAKKSKNTIISIIFVSGFVIAGLGIVMNFYGKEYAESLTDKTELLEYANKEGGYNFQEKGLNRGTALVSTDLIFYRDAPLQRYLGMGLGSASASSLMNSIFYQRYGETLSYHYFMTSYILIEQGWIGFVLYLALWIFLFLRIRQIKFKNTNFMFWRSFGLILIIQIIISIWYNSSLVSDDTWFLFLFLAIPFIYYKQRLGQINQHKLKNKSNNAKDTFNSTILP